MDDSEPVHRGAVIQATPAFLDREATLDKAIALSKTPG